jgi:hypothetical protein
MVELVIMCSRELSEFKEMITNSDNKLKLVEPLPNNHFVEKNKPKYYVQPTCEGKIIFEEQSNPYFFINANKERRREK